MSRRSRQNNADAPGNDSFLDVVANMVGILIILVMVVGVQAKDAFLAAGRTKADPPSAPLDARPVNNNDEQRELENSRRRVAALHAEVRDLATSAQSIGRESLSRMQLRSQLTQMKLAAEELIEKQRAELDQTQQEDFDLRRQLQAADARLEDLEIARRAVQNIAAPVVTLKHLPTPMAKTVFGEEEHFRLHNGRIVYVPLNALARMMKQQAELKLYKLKDSPQITETIGPLDGFSMQYTLVRRKVAVRTSNGTAVRDGVDLSHFMLVPVGGQLGEPLEDALEEGSEFRRRLRQFDPHATTITVWTYPDSFSDFRRLKDKLYELGYLTAGRPMPEGHPIGGSPQGTRSGAQ